jgi:PAS domain S-box-containing protein
VVRKALFESLLECLPDGVVMVDSDGRITSINAQTEMMFGYARDELLGKPVEVLVPERFRLGHLEYRAKYISQPVTRPMGLGLEITGRRKDGSDFPLEISLSPVAAEEGDFVISVIRDITRRKRMEQALRESEQRYRDLAHEMEQKLIISDRLVSLGELAATIAHELNNPLGIVIGFAQELLTEIGPSDPHYQPLKIIEEEANRCKKIMRDLLDFARPAPPSFVLTDIPYVVKRSMDLVSGHLQKFKVKAVIDFQPDLPRTYADAQQLEQVLVNLFFNAAEAMPEGGTLTVRAAAQPAERNELTIAVSDTGVGIDAYDLPNIFRPFFTTKTKRGMGLGLSICESIIKVHGGKIEAESAPGKGTTFYLRLPLERRRDESFL